ncbi:hypothetical protein B0H14DRAFT_869301 [Mycena olivaceomarginata]|nr:hypothetical protein B0H14DRAFT_869301 [Mycena olivaceomarginata]
MTPDPSAQALSQKTTLGIMPTSGTAPCAECKRLKLKCDKIIPCASCVRRGCGETCPNGIYLPTGRGRRTVPTEASRLRHVLSGMQARMKELETAVIRATNYHSAVCPYRDISSADKDSSADKLAKSVCALSIKDTGNARYYGPSAGTEALLSIEVIDDPDAEDVPRTFTAMTDSFSVGFRGTTAWDPHNALVQLFSHLPAKSRAWALVELYFENGCWSGTPIMRDEHVELLALVYARFNAADSRGSGAVLAPTCSVHQLAVIYGVFALGALVDLTLPPYNAESEHYFDLCRAALSALSLFDDTSTATVQALVLVSVFYSHGGPRFSMDGAWSVISLASNLGKSMGLHTGRSQPGLAAKHTQQRRALFWEIYAIETLQSLAVGRPTSTYLAGISCPFPIDVEQSMDDRGSILPGFYHRRWQFIKQVAAPVLETYLTAQAPSYQAIVELDQRIRKFMHSAMCTSSTPDEDRSSPATYFQRRTIHEACMNMLVYIHNRAFIQALRENPTGPYYTSRAISYLSAYRYASEIIRANIDNFKHHPQLFSRWWPTWKTIFNAGMIVGAVAAKSPQDTYGPQGLLELFVAVELFEGGAAASYRARRALNILHKLRAKAMTAYVKHSGSDEFSPPDTDTDVALDIFAGRTRIVAQSILTRDCRAHRVPNVSPAPVGPAAHPTTEAVMKTRLDPDTDLCEGTLSPTLVEYFSSGSARPEFDVGVAQWTRGAGEYGWEAAVVPTSADARGKIPSGPPPDLASMPLFDLGASPPADLGSVAENDFSFSSDPSFLDPAHDPQWMDFLRDL